MGASAFGLSGNLPYFGSPHIHKHRKRLEKGGISPSLQSRKLRGTRLLNLRGSLASAFGYFPKDVAGSPLSMNNYSA